VAPATISVKLNVSPASAVRGDVYDFTATAYWPNGQPFAASNTGAAFPTADAGYLQVFNNLHGQPNAIPIINLTYANGVWSGSFQTVWNTLTGNYDFTAEAYDSLIMTSSPNMGASPSVSSTLSPATLTVTPWGEEELNGNSTSGTLFLNFNVTYPSDLVSTASGPLGFLPNSSINANHLEVIISVNGHQIGDGYDWMYNPALSTKGTAVYSLYTIENGKAILGWPLGSNYPAQEAYLGNFTLHVLYFNDNATAPNTGSGMSAFPVVKVITQPIASVQQSKGESVSVTATVYSAGNWSNPAINAKLLPISFVAKLWEYLPVSHAHIYAVTLSPVSGHPGEFSGSLAVDSAPNTGSGAAANAGMYAGEYWANESLNFGAPYLLPTVNDTNAGSLTVTGDLHIAITKPTMSTGPYHPNGWYSVNGTVTDNYGHPVSGVPLNFFVPSLAESLKFNTENGYFAPIPNQQYLLVIPEDAALGNYTGTATAGGSGTFYLPASASTTFEVTVIKPISVAASVTPSTIYNGTSGEIVATVTSSGQPLSGATVTAKISAPNGTSTIALSASSTPGVYTAPIFIAPTGPAGLYTVTVTASESGYVSGSAVATFQAAMKSVPVVALPQIDVSVTTSPANVYNGTTVTIAATVTANGKALTGATVSGTISGPSGSASLAFAPSSSAGVYTATYTVPAAGQYTVSVTASESGYATGSSGTAFSATTTTPPPKAPTVNLTYVYLLAGLAALFALIALIYIAVK
ncbi:MAG: FixH family protein, partial [Conexivisphaerales archaeon]|nr:FixH family protein [Conexivisphaerales archaeon]